MVDFFLIPEMFSFIFVAFQNHETIPVYIVKKDMRVILLNKIEA